MFRKCRRKQTNKDSDDESNEYRRRAYQDKEDTTNVELVSQNITVEDKETITNALQRNNFFMALASKASQDVANYMTPREVRTNEVLLKQGDIGDSFYVSKFGKFQVATDSAETPIHFEDCRVFGELAILYDNPRFATVTALTDGAVWTLSRKNFKAILSQFNIKRNENLLEFLAKVPVLKQLSTVKLQKIADLCEDNIYFSKDTVIIKENDRGDEFFIIRTGSVTISHSAKGTLATLTTAGDCFGERALLHNDDLRQATVTAGEYGIECVILNRKHFNEFLGDFKNFFESDSPQSSSTSSQPKEDRSAKYKYIELKKLTRVRFLGEGSFGTVRLVKCERNQKLALKSMDKEKLHACAGYHVARNEYNIMKMCDSPFILKLYRIFEDAHKFYFLLEYCPHGDLFTILQRAKHKFNGDCARFTAACIAEALIYLHRRDCVFLDLKPENICIGENFYPKLLDFGNAIKLQPGAKMYNETGTREYMAPEIYTKAGYDFGADYWALGVLIYEMHRYKSPFASADLERIPENVCRGLSRRHLDGLKKPVADIVQKFMNMNPAMRLGCQHNGDTEIRKHEFFNEIDFARLYVYEVKSPLRKLKAVFNR